jgi:hypothetical protein
MVAKLAILLSKFIKAGFQAIYTEDGIEVRHCRKKVFLSSLGARCVECGYSKGIQFSRTEMKVFIGDPNLWSCVPKCTDHVYATCAHLHSDNESLLKN